MSGTYTVPDFGPSDLLTSPAGALGTLDHFTDGWAMVSWDSDPTRPLNYRPHDLDAA